MLTQLVRSRARVHAQGSEVKALVTILYHPQRIRKMAHIPKHSIIPYNLNLSLEPQILLILNSRLFLS